MTRPIEFCRDLLSTYKSFLKWHHFLRGHYYFTRHLFLNICRRLFQFDVLYIYSKCIKPTASDPIAGIDIGIATPQELDAIKALNPKELNSFVSQRLANREQCYVARRSNQLCAYFWLAPGKRTFDYRSYLIPIPPGHVYIRDVQTLPEHRGRGILPIFLKWINNELSKTETEKMWAAIRSFNYSSQRSFSKSGFKVESTIYFAALPMTSIAIMVRKTVSRNKQQLS